MSITWIQSNVAKGNCTNYVNKFKHEAINITALNRMIQQEFVSIQDSGYINNKNKFPVDQEQLITDISLNSTANMKVFAETLVQDNKPLMDSETFLIVQVMEYIDKKLLYSRTIIRFTFNLQHHLQQIKICVKIFGIRAHGGVCDFNVLYPFASIGNDIDKIAMFVNVDKLDSSVHAFVSFENTIIASISSLIYLPKGSDVFMKTEMSKSFNPITMFQFMETKSENILKHGSIFPIEASPSTTYLNKCETNPHEKWCQLLPPCISETSYSCKYANYTDMNETMFPPTLSFIDFEHLDRRKLKTITLHLRGKRGQINAFSSDQKIRIISIHPMKSKPSYQQNPLNVIHSNLFALKLNNTARGSFESSHNCLSMRILIVFPNNATQTCHFKSYPRVYFLANNHLIFLGHIQSNHSLWKNLTIEGFEKVTNITTENFSKHDNFTNETNSCQGHGISLKHMMYLILFPIKVFELMLFVLITLLIFLIRCMLKQRNGPPDLPIKDYVCEDEETIKCKNTSTKLQNCSPNFNSKMTENNKRESVLGSKEVLLELIYHIFLNITQMNVCRRICL